MRTGRQDNSSDPSAPARRVRHGGLDVLRVAGMVAIALQHLLTVSGYRSPPLFFHLDLGQLGVATFCAISGYLAFGATNERPGPWIWRRFKRIYLPFWMAVIAVFTANAVVPYKQASLALLLAELSGLGYFLYPGHLLGVHFWFVSLILVCYIAAWLIRMARWLAPPIVALVVVYLHLRPDSLVTPNLLAFLAAGCVVHARRAGVPVAVVIILASSALALWHGTWASVAAGTITLLAGQLLAVRPSRLMHKLNTLSYEFYLVHGPVYIGLRKLAGFGLIANALVGTFVAVIGAWLLTAATGQILRLPAYWRLWRRRRFARRHGIDSG